MSVVGDSSVRARKGEYLDWERETRIRRWASRAAAEDERRRPSLQSVIDPGRCDGAGGARDRHQRRQRDFDRRQCAGARRGPVRGDGGARPPRWPAAHHRRGRHAHRHGRVLDTSPGRQPAAVSRTCPASRATPGIPFRVWAPSTLPRGAVCRVARSRRLFSRCRTRPSQTRWRSCGNGSDRTRRLRRQSTRLSRMPVCRRARTGEPVRRCAEWSRLTALTDQNGTPFAGCGTRSSTKGISSETCRRAVIAASFRRWQPDSMSVWASRWRRSFLTTTCGSRVVMAPSRPGRTRC